MHESIEIRESLNEMSLITLQADMGGAAALLGAFEAAVSSGLDSTSLHLLLCLAENAIGPEAFRHDDIICLLSGKVRLSTARRGSHSCTATQYVARSKSSAPSLCGASGMKCYQ